MALLKREHWIHSGSKTVDYNVSNRLTFMLFMTCTLFSSESRARAVSAEARRLRDTLSFDSTCMHHPVSTKLCPRSAAVDPDIMRTFSEAHGTVRL